MPGSIAVMFSCDRCKKTLADVVPLGPREPRGTLCWSCGGPRNKTGCTECGLLADALDAVAAFVRTSSDPATDARSLLERGYYRTGLAILHCAAGLRPDDARIGVLREPLIASAG
jgi:hypothetical protein